MDPNRLFSVRLPGEPGADTAVPALAPGYQDDDAPPPPDPPCAACRHPMSRHDDDACDDCEAWGGPCG